VHISKQKKAVHQGTDFSAVPPLLDNLLVSQL